MFSREELSEIIMRNRGLEDLFTIWFLNLCENSELSEEYINSAFLIALTEPLSEEPEEQSWL